MYIYKKMSQTSQLDQKKCVEVLVKCVAKGQTKGCYSIKDASQLYNIISKKLVEPVEWSSIDALIQAVVIAHGKGSFNLEESAVIDEVVEFLVKANESKPEEKEI